MDADEAATNLAEATRRARQRAQQAIEAARQLTDEAEELLDESLTRRFTVQDCLGPRGNLEVEGEPDDASARMSADIRDY